jgi:hypothetical protein
MEICKQVAAEDVGKWLPPGDKDGKVWQGALKETTSKCPDVGEITAPPEIHLYGIHNNSKDLVFSLRPSHEAIVTGHCNPIPGIMMSYYNLDGSMNRTGISEHSEFDRGLIFVDKVGPSTQDFNFFIKWNASRPDNSDDSTGGPLGNKNYPKEFKPWAGESSTSPNLDSPVFVVPPPIDPADDANMKPEESILWKMVGMKCCYSWTMFITDEVRYDSNLTGQQDGAPAHGGGVINLDGKSFHWSLRFPGCTVGDLAE